jgi:hypothetical protein
VRLPVVVLDGLGDLIEIPLLCFHIVSPSLQGNIVGTDTLNNSLHWQSRSNVEWSVDMETEVVVDSLGSYSISFIKIYYTPLLSSSICVTVNYNCMSFFILFILNTKCFRGLPIDELVLLVLEYLEPI